MTPDLNLHEMTSLHDPYLLPWLDLYESAFPPEERVPVSSLLRALLASEQGTPRPRKLWALLDAQDVFLGLAQANWNENYHLVYLGYFAVSPHSHGQGLGSAFFRLLLPHLQGAVGGGSPDFLLFDVERPDRLDDPVKSQIARRRIGFYERLGAAVLPGASFYWGSVVQRMMFYRFTPIDVSEIRARAALLLLDYGGELRPDDA